MKSRPAYASADREKAGGIYAGIAGFTIVWIIGFASGVPFRETVWKGIGCAIAMYVLTTFLLRIVLRIEVPEASQAPEAQEATTPETQATAEKVAET